MGAPKPTLGYRSRTDAVLALRAEGLSDRQIADRIGIPPKNVASLAVMSGKARLRPSEQFGRTIVFPIDILERLGPAATARGITVNELARRIVETVVDDGLIDSVLDDDDEMEAARA